MARPTPGDPHPGSSPGQLQGEAEEQISLHRVLTAQESGSRRIPLGFNACLSSAHKAWSRESLPKDRKVETDDTAQDG